MKRLSPHQPTLCFTVWLALTTLLWDQTLLAQTSPRVHIVYSATVAGDSIGLQADESGQHVLFASNAPDLVSKDRNGPGMDLFLEDMTNGQLSLISVNHAGTGSGNHGSLEAIMNDSGSRVVFSSEASDLVPDDTNDQRDIFVRDLMTQETALITRTPDGAASNGASNLWDISGDGRFVLFTSDASNLLPKPAEATLGLFLQDTQEGKIHLLESFSNPVVPWRNAHAYPIISSDGKYVIYARVDEAVYRYGRDNCEGFSLWIYDVLRKTTAPVNLEDLIPEDSPEESCVDTSHLTVSDDGTALCFLATVRAAGTCHLVRLDLANGDRSQVLLPEEYFRELGALTSRGKITTSHHGRWVSILDFVWDTMDSSHRQILLNPGELYQGNSLLLSPRWSISHLAATSAI